MHIAFHERTHTHRYTERCFLHTYKSNADGTMGQNIRICYVCLFYTIHCMSHTRTSVMPLCEAINTTIEKQNRP